jgi:hypothetical protein
VHTLALLGTKSAVRNCISDALHPTALTATLSDGHAERPVLHHHSVLHHYESSKRAYSMQPYETSSHPASQQSVLVAQTKQQRKCTTGSAATHKSNGGPQDARCSGLDLLIALTHLIATACFLLLHRRQCPQCPPLHRAVEEHSRQRHVNNHRAALGVCCPTWLYCCMRAASRDCQASLLQLATISVRWCCLFRLLCCWLNRQRAPRAQLTRSGGLSTVRAATTPERSAASCTTCKPPTSAQHPPAPALMEQRCKPCSSDAPEQAGHSATGEAPLGEPCLPVG